MQRYIALLGGINVGGHRVKMADLRLLFEALGFSQVATFIASGNVIFETSSTEVGLLQQQIEQHLAQALGYRVPTFLRTADEIAAVAHYQPFPDEMSAAEHTLSVMFLTEPLPEEAQQTFLAFATPIDSFHIYNREIYWLCRAKTTESLVDWPRLGKALKMPPVTVRNITTVRKLAAKYTD